MRRLGDIFSAKGAENMTYIHERPNWPTFQWNAERLAATLGEVRHQQGRLIGQMTALGFALQSEAVLATLTKDVLKSSEIEGEILDEPQVRSSIARRLGMDIAGLVPADRHVEGVVEMMLDATQKHGEPLTKDRLFAWHAALFPSGRSGMTSISVGKWRTDERGPMQVVSGAIGREKVHFQAPSAPDIETEMHSFLEWFEGKTSIDPVLKASLAHLWFVTVHPFDDGNGRIARAVADLALARSENTNQRFYSMSSQIRVERTAYYDLLEATQKSSLDVTAWHEWFLACLMRAFVGAEENLAGVLNKARFWDEHRQTRINDRQRVMINRLFNGFEGKLNTSKWAKITRCSQDTALRDIEALIGDGVLRRDEGGGRSTSYSLVSGTAGR